MSDMDVSPAFAILTDVDTQTVLVVGELDISTAHQIERALAEFESGSVHLDLTRVAYIDSSGLNVLTQAHNRLERRGDRLTVVVTEDPRVLRPLSITRLDGLLHLAWAEPLGS